mmetsp:Transcript_23918/g.20902  ORF Transcript_23918/g.20902 Transcript_23918/m.20902 type:complete len:362 (+) Transcript_23918:1658-2743(+)
MSGSDRRLLKCLNDGKNFSETINLGLQFLVGLPFFQVLGQSKTLLSKFVGLLFHFQQEVGVQIIPSSLFPFINLIQDFVVEIIQLLEVFKLTLSLEEGRVLLVSETKQVFTCFIDVKLSLTNTVFVIKSSETIVGFFGFNTRHHRTIVFKVLSEFFDIDNEVFDISLELSQEVTLSLLQSFNLLISFFDEGIPIGSQNRPGIHFLGIKSGITTHEIIQELIHFVNWTKSHVDFSLLDSNLFESVHDHTKGIDILDLLLERLLKVFGFLGQFIQKSFGSLVQFISITILPFFNPLLETLFQGATLKRNGTDIECRINGFNRVFSLQQTFQFIFIIHHVRIRFAEFLDSVRDRHAPELFVIFE